MQQFLRGQSGVRIRLGGRANLTRVLRLTLAVWLLSGPSSISARQVPAPRDIAAWHSVPVPGGVAALSTAAGLDRPLDRFRVVMEAARRLHGASDGAPDIARAEAVRLHLTTAETQAPASSDETVPLPMAPDLWTRHILRATVPERGLIRAILSDRGAALLYCGLASLDDPTRRFFATNLELLAAIQRRRAGVFAAFAHSLRVQDNHVNPPGGAEAAALWEDLIGERTSDPQRFIHRLFEKDGGRLAFFYDALAALDRPHARFALGLAGTGEGQRASRLGALYGVFSEVSPRWDVETQPFLRAPIDPGLILALLQVSADGALVPPASRGFWDAVFDGTAGSEQLADRLRKPDQRAPIDAAWVTERIVRAPIGIRREVLELFLFAPRVFGTAGENTTSSVLAAVMGFIRYPALMQTLERMGLTDPLLFSSAIEHANRLEASQDDALPGAVTQFQAAVALMERMRSGRVVGAQRAGDLLRQLFAVPFGDDLYGGRIAVWLTDTLLPGLSDRAGREEVRLPPPRAERASASLAEAFGRGGKPDTTTGLSRDTVELDVLRAMAGVRPARENEPPLRTIAWEDRNYVVDPAGSELARLQLVRRRQGGNSLDDVLDFCAAASAYRDSASGSPPSGSRVMEAAERLQPLAFAPGSRPINAADEVRAVLKRGGTRPVRAAAAGPLMRVCDVELADVMRSLVYAAALGDPDGAALLGSNVARRHVLGLKRLDQQVRSRMAWSLPLDERGTAGAWHVSGALLGLDIALSRLALRRLGMGADRSPALNANERRAYAESVVLMNPFDLTDASRDAIAAAIARGRARVKGMLDPPAAIDAVAEDGGISEWRRQVLPWIVAHDPAQIDRFFSHTELFWIGIGKAATAPAGVSSWGTASLTATGALRTDLPSRAPWEAFAGRQGAGLLSSRIPDLHLRIAEELHDRKLPGALARGILGAAVQDFIDEVDPMDRDDWWALVRHAQTLTRERVDDYISSLVAGGALMPVPTASDDPPLP